MNDKQPSIEELIAGILKLLPEDLASFKQEFENNLQSGLSSLFRKMDLVSREEYDVQTELLKRTRELVEELKLRIEELEQDIEDK